VNWHFVHFCEVLTWRSSMMTANIDTVDRWVATGETSVPRAAAATTTAGGDDDVALMLTDDAVVSSSQRPFSFHFWHSWLDRRRSALHLLIPSLITLLTVTWLTKGDAASVHFGPTIRRTDVVVNGCFIGKDRVMTAECLL